MKELFISEVTQLRYSLLSSRVLPPLFSAVELKMLIRQTELFIEWITLPPPHLRRVFCSPNGGRTARSVVLKEVTKMC